MKKLTIAMMATLAMAMPVIAQTSPGYYFLAHGEKLTQDEINEAITIEFRHLRYRIAELERKVSGLQKQVTLLHGKKADKAPDHAAK